MIGVKMLHKDVVYHKLRKFEKQDVRTNHIARKLKLRDITFSTLDLANLA